MYKNNYKRRNQSKNNQNQLRQIYKENEEYCSNQLAYLSTQESTKFTFDQINEYSCSSDYNDNLQLEVVNEDAFQTVRNFGFTNDDNVLVLNLASEYKPGGGAKNGRIAQEESLFYQSNYHLTLTEDFYPIESNELIYSPQVTIFRNKEYEIERNKITVSCVALPALRKPKLVNYEYTEMQYNSMFNKINALFRLAIQNEHRILILGALGCGVFLNPSHQVAEIFKVCIDRYSHYFDHIIFAVLKDNRNDNFEVFSETLLN